METKYSREPFEGYTHRYGVRFEIGEPNFHNIDIYSNSDSYQELDDYINRNKSDKVLRFTIVHRTSKEQDERETEFIHEVLEGI